VGSRTGLDDVERSKSLTVPGLELRHLSDLGIEVFVRDIVPRYLEYVN
jgi:hypothetical protein